MPMYSTCNREYIEAVSRFIFVEDMPHASDVILIPGSSHDAHVLHAGSLYLSGYAPYLLPSGFHAFSKEAFDAVPGFASEWAWIRSILLSQGVPEHAILREDQSTFTWENAVFSRRATDAIGLDVRDALLCCRAHHARRALFYYQAAYPQARIHVIPVSDPDITRDNWYLTEHGRHTVLGEVRRLGSQVEEIFDCLMENREPPARNTKPWASE